MKKNNNSETQMIYEAINLTKEKKYDSAERIYMKVLDSNPKNLIALNNLANVYKIKKEWENINDCIDKIRKYHLNEDYSRGLRLRYEIVKSKILTHRKLYEYFFVRKIILVIRCILALFLFLFNLYNTYIILFEDLHFNSVPLIELPINCRVMMMTRI